MIYGIYRNIKSSSPEWTRTDDSIGLENFYGRYPWSEIEFGTGERTGLIKIPKFWFRYYQEGDIVHIMISDHFVKGFDLHPSFVKDGFELDYAYIEPDDFLIKLLFLVETATYDFCNRSEGH